MALAKLDAARWRALANYLDHAFELAETERAAWLASLEREDPALAAELQTLLGEHGALVRSGFLEHGMLSLPGRFEERGPDSPEQRDQPRYALGEEHARGGMGRILRAEDIVLGRVVAIKELLHDDAQAEARFVRETRLTARLQHPSIVPVYDAGRWQTTGKLFYSMKLVGGKPLSEVAASGGSVRERLALVPNVIAITDAVAYAHGEGIIHRDLKPANVLLGAYGETLVVDWGLAKDLRAPEPAGSAAPISSEQSYDSGRDAMTAVGAVMGTPAFMPPEQARGLEVDERADVYAIGAILYFVLALAPPYSAKSPRQILEAVRAGPPPALAGLVPELPADLCAIVEKAMAREPERRYPTARELAEDLRRFVTGQMVTAREYSARQILAHWARRHRAIATLSAAFLLTALVGTTVFVVREQGLRRQAQASQLLAEGQSNALLLEHGRRELALGRPLRAITYLSAVYEREPSQRDVRYLVTQAARPLQAHAHGLRGHERDVVAVAFSPDGAQLATGSTDLSVRLWDALSGRAGKVLQGARSSVEDVAWSADGQLVASAEDVITVWDAHSGAIVKQLERPGFRLRFSQDGRWLAAGSMSGRLCVWSTRDWQPAFEGFPHHSRVSAIEFHPNGQRALTTSWDGSVLFWELPAWRPSERLEDHRAPVATAAFSADGRWLLTGDSDVTLHVRDASSGAILHTLRLPEGSRWMNAFFSPDARSIVTGTFDGVIRVWHAASGALLASIDAIPDGKLFDSALSPDGQSVATVGLSGGDLWRLDAVRGVRVIGGGSHEDRVVYPAALARDSRQILASIRADVGPLNRLMLWDAQSGAEVDAWDDLGSGYSLAASADLSRFVSAGADDRIAPRLWQTAGRRLVRQLDHGGKRIRSAAMSRDGALVATGSDEDSVRLWAGDTGAPVADPLPLGETPTALAFSPDGKRLAVASSSGRLRIRDLSQGQWSWDVKAHPTWINGVEYAGSGDWLVSAGRQDHVAKIWNAHDSELRATLTGHTDNLISASFSPDESLVATASVDNTARLWDARTGELLRSIHGPSYTARFNADGRELLTTGVRDYVALWDVTLDPRGPREIAELVARHSPWQLREGRLVLRAEASAEAR
jgi:WD40 repeat protein